MSAMAQEPSQWAPTQEDRELIDELSLLLVKGMRKKSLIQLKFALAMLEAGSTGRMIVTVVRARLIEFTFLPEMEGHEVHFGWNTVTETRRPQKGG